MQSWRRALRGIDAGPAQHVEALVGGEALGHVGRVVDVDDPMASPAGRKMA